MTLQTDIATWNVKSATDIRAIYNRYAHTSRFCHTLINLCQHPDLERGSTWLLKHHCEQTKKPLTTKLAENLYTAAPKLQSWAARLHILQSMQHVPVPASRTRQAVRFLDACLASENKLVRAWAYSGYYELALTHPRFRTEASELLDDARNTETAPSILARVRLLRKAGFPAS